MIARRGLRISVRLRRERGGQRSPSKGSWSVRYLEEDFMRERSKESLEREGLTRIVRLQLHGACSLWRRDWQRAQSLEHVRQARTKV